MVKSLYVSIAALLVAATPFASATTISIDFEEFAYGTVIGDYYNHGKDSNNRASGAYYGVTFSGGSVKYTPRGAYLSSGPARVMGITIDPEVVRSILGTDMYYVTFNAGWYGVDPAMSGAGYANGYNDIIYISGNGNPYCSSDPSYCDFPYHNSMGGYYTSVLFDNSPVIRVGFTADLVDNIQIHSLAPGESPVRPPSIVGSYATDRDIPEPASAALLSIGALALAARRRKRNSMVQPENQA
jgi:hypothetical protein